MELAPADFAPHWIEGHPAELYHADKTAVSSTSLRAILKSPATFREKFLNGQRETPAMKFGTLAHKAILEGPEFLRQYVVMPEFVGRTLDGRESTQSKEAKQKRDAWLAEMASEGRTVVAQDEFDKIRGMLDALMGHDDAMALIKDCVTEISGYYRDPETGIKCRIRPDILNFDLSAFTDYKTTVDCSREEFSRTMWSWRYDFQLANYRVGIQEITGKRVDHVAIIAQEKEPPYEVAVYVADVALLEKGEQDYRAALKRLRNCIDSDSWPRYQIGVQDISLPHYAFND